MHDTDRLGVIGGEPVDSSANLATVGGHTGAGLKVGCAQYFAYCSVVILYDIGALYNICTHEPPLAAGFHAVEFRRRIVGKIVAVDIQFTRERDAARAE